VTAVLASALTAVATAVQPPPPVGRPPRKNEMAECVRTLRALVGVVGVVQHALDRLGRQIPGGEPAVKKRKARKKSGRAKRKA
jgi:hypothetical protein